MSLVAATLFSGIGAPEVAMPHWNWAWHAEIEKFPSAVMAARHPNSVNIGDVTAHDFTQRAQAIARPDVLVFGSPCQSYSIAGKRLGLDDPRGNLALTALRIVERLKPRWFLFENVPGLFSSWSGEAEGPVSPGAEWDSEENSDFVAFLSLVDELGYSGAWSVLDAQYRGVAQRRDRLFFAGHSGDWRASAAVLLEPESLCGNSPPRRQAGSCTLSGALGGTSPGGGWRFGADEAAANQLVSLTPGDRGVSVDQAAGGMLIARTLLAKENSSHDESQETYVAYALNAKGGSGRSDGESETFVTHALRAEGFDASEDGTGRGTPLVATSFDWRASASRSMNPSDITDALSGRADRAVAWDLRNGTEDDVAQTLQAAGLGTERGGNPNAIPHTLAQGGVRRLTPRECERLQGFPDDYTLIEYRGKPAADGPRYKALGNSMAVPVIRWILNRIEIFETQVRPIIERAA